MFYHDHSSLEEFVRALANAAEYTSRDAGDVITTYWRDEAREWVKELDARVTPTLPVSATRAVSVEDIARKLSGYDDATWLKLREDRKRTYKRAAESLITQWPEFAKLFEAK